MKTFFALMPAMLLLACLVEPCTALESKYFAISEKTLSMNLGPEFEISRGEFDPGENGMASEEFTINNTAAPGSAFLALFSIYDDVMRKMSTDALGELFLIGGISRLEADGNAETGNWTAVDFIGKNVTIHTFNNKDNGPNEIEANGDVAIWNLEGQTYAVLFSTLDRNDTEEIIRTLSIVQT